MQAVGSFYSSSPRTPGTIGSLAKSVESRPALLRDDALTWLGYQWPASAAFAFEGIQGLGFTIAGILVASVGASMTVASRHPLPLVLGTAGAAGTVIWMRKKAIATRRLTLQAITVAEFIDRAKK
jgi:hypothetical protein